MTPDDEPPILGTWPRLYAAIGLWAVLVIGLVALFSRFPW